jgi:peptidoglycan hydrolase-like protein with peptidoglycan-binding domain
MYTKELNMAKQATHTRLPAGVKAAFAVLAMGAAALFGGCENETNSTLIPIVYSVSLGTKQIRVEDTTGQTNPDAIQGVLTSINNSYSAENSIIYFKAMSTNPVMVIENTHNFRVENDKFFIGINKTDIDGIFETILRIYNVLGTPLMSKGNAEVPGTKFAMS